MLCDLLNIKYIGGRRRSDLKLTIDTEYISRASRALAAVTPVKRVAANEIADSGAMQEMWIDGCRANYWTLVGIVTRCILMGLVLLWRKFKRGNETVDDGTQTLEEGRFDQDIPLGVMITKHGKAVHCRNDCPIPFEIVFDSISELVFLLRSKQRFRKAIMEAAHWVMRTSFELQNVLY